MEYYMAIISTGVVGDPLTDAVYGTCTLKSDSWGELRLPAEIPPMEHPDTTDLKTELLNEGYEPLGKGKHPAIWGEGATIEEVWRFKEDDNNA